MDLTSFTVKKEKRALSFPHQNFLLKIRYAIIGRQYSGRKKPQHILVPEKKNRYPNILTIKPEIEWICDALKSKKHKLLLTRPHSAALRVNEDLALKPQGHYPVQPHTPLSSLRGLNALDPVRQDKNINERRYFKPLPQDSLSWPTHNPHSINPRVAIEYAGIRYRM